MPFGIGPVELVFIFVGLLVLLAILAFLGWILIEWARRMLVGRRSDTSDRPRS